MKRWIGVILAAVLAGLAVVAIAIGNQGDDAPQAALVRGVIGSEKKPFFDDPRVKAAYDRPVTAGHYTSIVLMTDGENTDGADYAAFEAHYRSLPEEQRRAPTFVVLFGESDAEEMRQVAELTGGAVFDARKTSLTSAFKEIRGYQ